MRCWLIDYFNHDVLIDTKDFRIHKIPSTLICSKPALPNNIFPDKPVRLHCKFNEA